MKLTIAHSGKKKIRINYLNNASPKVDTTDIFLRYLCHENDKRYNESWDIEDLILAVHNNKEITDISR